MDNKNAEDICIFQFKILKENITDYKGEGPAMKIEMDLMLLLYNISNECKAAKEPGFLFFYQSGHGVEDAGKAEFVTNHGNYADNRVHTEAVLRNCASVAEGWLQIFGVFDSCRTDAHEISEYRNIVGSSSKAG